MKAILRAAAAIGGLTVLAGAAQAVDTTPANVERVVQTCFAEVSPEGSYVTNVRGDDVIMTPVRGSGASHYEAQALTSCIAYRFGASTVTAAANPNRYISVSEQRSAILDCKHKFGIGGGVRLGGQWQEIPIGQQTRIWIVPHGRVTPEAANRINACADQALGRGGSPVVKVTGVARRASPCPKHAPVMYGGTQYCIGNPY